MAHYWSLDYAIGLAGAGRWLAMKRIDAELFISQDQADRYSEE